MSNRKRLKKSHARDADACCLCLSSADDEINLGKKCKTEIGNLHYFCVLFACGLEQRGKDEEGVFGFLTDDIRKEVLRAQKLKCKFCRVNNCASACAIPTCRMMFHYNCGLNNNILYLYSGSFPSYCPNHRPTLPKQYSNIDNDLTCHICLEKFVSDENEKGILKYKILLTECCKKFCSKGLAYNAGLYHIKCPLCNNRDKFVRTLQCHGVYIPESDASWELDNQRWRDQETRYSKCDSSICKCPNGRKFNDDSWEIIVCSTCGSFGSHETCNKTKIIDPDLYECPACSDLTQKLKLINKVNHQPNVQHSSDDLGNDSDDNIIETLKDDLDNNSDDNINETLKDGLDNDSDGNINETLKYDLKESLKLNKNLKENAEEPEVQFAEDDENDNVSVIVIGDSDEQIECHFDSEDQLTEIKDESSEDDKIVTSSKSNYY